MNNSELKLVQTETTELTPDENQKRPSKIRIHKRQGGFGLIEIMIGLIIMLLGLVAIMSRGDNAFSSSDGSNELGHVSSLITGTKQLKTSSGYGVSTDLTTTLYTNGAVPADMTYASSKLYNSWNGQVTIVSTATGVSFTVNILAYRKRLASHWQPKQRRMHIQQQLIPILQLQVK